MRQRLKSAFEHFVDVREQSDAAVAELMRRREIDIAVDLMGFTAHNRLGVLARRPAPVQVNYLGHLGTMGAPYIDYMFADHVVIADSHRKFYSERIFIFQAASNLMIKCVGISNRTFTHAECDLPQDSFVFCSFNANYKIDPDVFLWMGDLEAGAR